MGVGIHQAGQEGYLAEVTVGGAAAGRFDRDDLLAFYRDRAAFQGRLIDREKPARGEREHEKGRRCAKSRDREGAATVRERAPPRSRLLPKLTDRSRRR